MSRALLTCLLSILLLGVPLSAVAFDEVENPESIEPVDHEVVEEEFQKVARPRVVMRIEVEQGDDTQVGAAMAQALRDGLRNEGEARVASVFAYYPGDDTDGPYTAGIGMASKDGKGWTGDGDLLGSMPSGTSDEKDKIFVVVDSALDGLDEATQLVFPLEQESGTGNDNDDGDRARAQDDRDAEDDNSITAQEQEYIDGLNAGMIELGEASTEMGEQFTDAGENPSLITDDEWAVQTAAQFVRIQQVAEDAEELAPSDRQEHIQELWLAINELTTAAVDDYIEGIDSLDPALLEQGAARYVYAGLLVEDVIAARDAFNDDPTDPVEPEHVIGPVQECGEFESFADAQEYYPAHPEEQPTIDPDFDGLACEVFFDQEAAQAPTSVPQQDREPAQDPQPEPPVQQEPEPEVPVEEEPAQEPAASGCDPNYTPCVPISSADLDCADVGFSVTIVGSDPHGFDGNDNDGLGCESY